MGCWNETCALTNLPIFAGEDVAIILITEKGGYYSTCYTTPTHIPFPVAAYGKYDDYGSAEDVHGMEPILSAIRRNLIEVPQGENKYHEKKISIEGFDEDMLWDAARNGRLRIKSRYSEKGVRVIPVMIKMNVVNHLMDTYTFKEYVYDTQEHDKYTFRQLLSDAEHLLSTVSSESHEADMIDSLTDGDPEEIARLIELKNSDPVRFKRMLRRSLTGDVFDGMTDNRAARWLRPGGHLSYGELHFRIGDAIGELKDSGDDKALKLLKAHLTVLFIDHIMLETRKSWTVTGGRGSQAESFHAYRALNEAMEIAMKARASCFEDEDEDEE